jgi:lysophospholipase L1-like esterase
VTREETRLTLENWPMRRVHGTLLLVIISQLFGVVCADDFAIRDGDTVVFLGDSITAARTYGKLIENYTLLRYPTRRARFINAGKGGETAEGALTRLERDIFSRKATVLTVAYGVNDIGWGLHADDQHRQRYLKAIVQIVQQCKQRGVRVYICSAAVTGADPSRSEDDFLQSMCDEGMKLARENGGQSIDVQRTMREIQKSVWKANEKIEDASKKESLHVADNVHLSELGQTAMAYAILKGLGAPDDVSSVSLDVRDRTLLASAGCKISDIAGMNDRIEFTRLDDGLPLNAQTFFALHFRYVPIHERLNRYLLQLKSLPDGQYDLTVDGRKVGTWSSRQLAAGINISSSTPDPWQPGGPWDAQANILYSLTESRDKLDLSGLLAGAHLPEINITERYMEEVQSVNQQIEALQRLIAAPRPYRFVVQRVKATEKAKESSQ